MQIALCKLFGLTDEEAAKRVSTPEFPEGCSLRTVQNRLAKGSETARFIRTLIEWGVPLVRGQREEIEQVSKEQHRAEYEKLRGMILTVRKSALKSEDLQLANKIADTIEDRLDGKAVSRMEMLAKHEHEHRLVSDGSIERLEKLFNKLDNRPQLTGSVIDVSSGPE